LAAQAAAQAAAAELAAQAAAAQAAAQAAAAELAAQAQAAAAQAAAPTVVVDELALSRSLIAAKNYRKALIELKKVDRIVINNADVNNLLGFASRKLAQYSQAGVYYVKALKINPSHLGALEYQGELYLIQKKVSLAKQNLAKLKKICGTTCEEYLDLQKAIALSMKKG
jgi:tetratricopeptide (TPR) repeat protein